MFWAAIYSADCRKFRVHKCLDFRERGIAEVSWMWFFAFIYIDNSGNFCMKNFHGCAKNRENRESFLPRKFHGIRYHEVPKIIKTIV